MKKEEKETIKEEEGPNEFMEMLETAELIIKATKKFKDDPPGVYTILDNILEETDDGRAFQLMFNIQEAIAALGTMVNNMVGYFKDPAIIFATAYLVGQGYDSLKGNKWEGDEKAILLVVKAMLEARGVEAVFIDQMTGERLE